MSKTNRKNVGFKVSIALSLIVRKTVMLSFIFYFNKTVRSTYNCQIFVKAVGNYPCRRYFVCIIYGILIGGWSQGGAQPFETKYYNVPNIVGDYGVYISENFYVENNYSIPTKAEVYISNKHKVNRYQKDGYGADIVGRGEKLGYEVSIVF